MRNLKALEAYLEVATLGSVTAAAKRLGLSQPSVSRLIQELERELGQPLFQRVDQRLVLTRQGMLMRDDVERALAGVADVMQRARELADEDAKPLRIAAVSAVSFGLLPHAWARVQPEGRGELIVQTETPERVRSIVKEGRVDIGAGSLPLEHRDLTIDWMGSASCVLAVREDDPLTSETGPLELSALRGRSMIQLGNRHGLPSRIRRALGEAGVEGAVVRTHSTMNALAFVRAGVGVAVVEPVSSAGTPIEGVRLLPLAVSIPYMIGAVTPRSSPPTARAQALLDALKAEAEARLPDFELHPRDTHQEIIVRLSQFEDRS